MNVRVCYNSALLFFHSAHSFLSFSPFPSFRALCFVIPSSLFCHSEHTFSVIPSVSEESSAWMLHFAQHDKTSRAQHSFFHSAHSFLSFSLFHHSAHSVSSFRALFFVIPSILFLSFRASARNPAHRCFASLSMTRPVMPSTLFFIPRTLFRHSELSFLSFRAYFFCHSERSEESST